jgi:hypothetical protein
MLSKQYIAKAVLIEIKLECIFRMQGKGMLYYGYKSIGDNAVA